MIEALMLTTLMMATEVPKLQCRPGQPTLCAAVLKAGQTSPISGVVLTFDLAAAVQTEGAEAVDECQAAAKADHDRCQSNMKAQREKFDAERELFMSELAAKDAQIEELRPRFYEHPLFVIGAVLVTEVALAVSIAAVAGAF